MRRKRRNHSANFKAKIALSALKEDKTVVELAHKHELHPKQIQDWKKQLLENADIAFQGSSKQEDGSEKKIKDLHEKIGQLTMERDFLSKGLAQWS